MPLARIRCPLYGPQLAGGLAFRSTTVALTATNGPTVSLTYTPSHGPGRGTPFPTRNWLCTAWNPSTAAPGRPEERSSIAVVPGNIE